MAKDPVAFVAGEQRDLLLKDGKPFVYVNVVLSNSQAFVPVLDMVRFLRMPLQDEPGLLQELHS